MSGDVNVLAMSKGGEQYVFVYTDENRVETLRMLGRYAADPQLSFSWYDAAVLSKKIREIDAEQFEAACEQLEPQVASRFSFRHTEDLI